MAGGVDARAARVARRDDGGEADGTDATDAADAAGAAAAAARVERRGRSAGMVVVTKATEEDVETERVERGREVGGDDGWAGSVFKRCAVAFARGIVLAEALVFMVRFLRAGFVCRTYEVGFDGERGGTWTLVLGLVFKRRAIGFFRGLSCQ